MKRALLMFSALALIVTAVGCQSACGPNCRRASKGLLDYDSAPCDGNCGRKLGRGGRGGGCDDGSCEDSSCDGACGGRCSLCARMRGRLGGGNGLHGGADAMGPVGPPTPQYTYPYYTTRGPRDFLLDNPPPIGY
jgi:hypothetical protein